VLERGEQYFNELVTKYHVMIDTYNDYNPVEPGKEF